MGAHSGVV